MSKKGKSKKEGPETARQDSILQKVKNQNRVEEIMLCVD